MGKQNWKPGNMLNPVPAVMVSVADKNGKANIITIAWAGTICTNPPMVSISVRPERHSYAMMKKTKEFVINLTTEKLAYATDYCGVRSGKDVDKFKEMKLTAEKSETLEYAPIIEECPVNIECKVTEIKELGSHHMFIANVKAVYVDEMFQSRGIGGMLLVKAIEKACELKTIEQVELSVVTEQSAAFALYQKNGFEVLPYMEMKKEN